VGRVIYDWADETTVDTLAPVPGTRRELLVWVWYPAAEGQPPVTTDGYIPSQMRAATSPARGLMSLLTGDVAKVHTHSRSIAEVAPQQPS